jgi:hypothetical protein
VAKPDPSRFSEDVTDFTADALTVTTATATVTKISNQQWTTELTATVGIAVGTLSVEMVAGQVKTTPSRPDGESRCMRHTERNTSRQ